VIRGLASFVLILAVGLTVAACGGSNATPSDAGPAASALPAGTYSSNGFSPKVTYTVPDGWENAADADAYFLLRPLGSDLAGIHLFRDAMAMSQDPTCPTSPAAGVGKTSTEMVAWMRTLKGLVVGQPVMATVGGLTGVSVDVAIASDWTQSCSFANGVPTVSLLTDGVDLRWVMAGSERLRLYILDRAGGGNVIVDLDAFDGTLFDSLVNNALPIVRSFQFATS
jgi:hypothetical protein